MEDLFTMAMEKTPDTAAPLADRMRARTLMNSSGKSIS